MPITALLFINRLYNLTRPLYLIKAYADSIDKLEVIRVEEYEEINELLDELGG